MGLRQREWMLAGITIFATVIAGSAIVGCSGKSEKAPQVFCGPDGKLTSTAPIQSHRSYCVRAYTSATDFKPGIPTDFQFDIINDQGTVLKQFATVHEKIMHVIVVRNDLTQFQHVHPTFDASSGRFTVEHLVLPSAGPYRIFADFTPAGGMNGPDGMPLSVVVPVDLEVGDLKSYAPEPLPAAANSVTTGGYEVTLSPPDTLRAGMEAHLDFTIRRDGKVVSDLEPYLGANAHGVVLREGDLAYIHTHAHEDPAALKMGKLPFMVHVPEPGRYRMFVQFQHHGTIHTAAFTLVVGSNAPAVGGNGHSGH